MKRHNLIPSFLIVVISFFLFNSCQHQEINKNNEPEQDMLKASAMAEDYLKNTNARTRGHEIVVTVLAYSDGKLYYATNKDNIRGYQEVTEETVTAIVEPGAYVFWFAGYGITYLDAIEFDEQSQSNLDNSSQVSLGVMWTVSIPEDNVDAEYLKYDIVYQYRGNQGAPVRLDPKLRVNQ